MDKMTKLSGFFRSMPVQWPKQDTDRNIFRSMPVHFLRKVGPAASFPEQPRSVSPLGNRVPATFFRSMPVHSSRSFSYFCARINKSSTGMAGTIKDMSLIKQVIQLKQLGESNRGVSRKLSINKGTVNDYVNTIQRNGWDYGGLLSKDDPELERMFHAGSPAYSDRRMPDFLALLPYYKEQLSNPKLHVTRQLLYEEYRAGHPSGYGKSQFYFHLQQNLVAQKGCTAVLTETYNPGEKLMVDFAGDKLGYIDTATGEVIKAEVFVACMPYSDYTYVICVPSQKTEDFLFAVRMSLEHLGGVPPILTPDNLKSAVISNDRHEPKLNKALEDMGNHYHFVVLPCDPKKPTQKALVEDKVRTTYNRIYAKLRGRTFHSIMELNKAVWEQLSLFNKTRMQKRPYSREERFHAAEKGRLKPLPQNVHEMKFYATLQVQGNCFVELRQDKVTHFYSVPYIYVGKKALVIFTRSVVNVYVDGIQAASHMRSHEYGHTYLKGHLASNCRAIMERSASYYITWASRISPECGDHISEVFNPQRTNQPEEVYYKLCASIMSLSRRYETKIINKTCKQCIDFKIFSYRKFESVLKHNTLIASEDEPATCFEAPVPTDHVNMRGSSYFQ